MKKVFLIIALASLVGCTYNRTYYVFNEASGGSTITQQIELDADVSEPITSSVQAKGSLTP